MFPEFADKIGSFIGQDKQHLIESDFSTTGPVEKVVSQIVLMDAMKSYFKYVMVCGCGIPYIELIGTMEVSKNACELRTLGLEKNT